ncbi:hypothetical protein O181_082971 [Austropuccinia psidii MF-1]|uniref:Reverse transcriptase Ty1/copia-type domain-containing protein n=1 Tax=Austropuccinia psidii MF-1 TaxID=1389203 RepID=A0A9Q3FN62_9BASI|nr:hypothetical protein [Austropuccinia psidii MF-1]
MNPTSLPNQYWAEAIKTAVFLLNLSPTHSRNGKSPHFLWSNIFPNLTGLQTFGCESVIHNLKIQKDWELSSHGQEGILLGFENEGTAYCILRLDDLNDVVTRKTSFNGKVFPSITGKPNSVQWTINGIDELLPLIDIHTDTQREEHSLSDPEGSLDVARYQETNNENVNGSDWSDEGQINQSCDESSYDSPVPSSNHLNNDTNSHSHEELWNIHKQRVKVIGPRHPNIITSNVDSMHILPYSQKEKVLLTTIDNAPKTYYKAIHGKNKLEWEYAIKKEFSTMNKLEVWDIIEFKSASLCKGIYPDPGIDFEKTYTPTGRRNSLRALIAHASFIRLYFHSIDIKSTFLNAPLTETVYLEIPQGLDIDCRKFCLRFNEAIYGLKQAPLAWYTRLKDWLQSVGFFVCNLDPCGFYGRGMEPLWIYVHVDDMAIFGKNIQPYKNQIHKHVSIKDIGPADLLMGVKIQHLEKGITLYQEHFFDSLLELYGMRNCKSISMPLVPNDHIGAATKDEEKAFKSMKVNFRSAIGSINYLRTSTCPDLSHAVSSLSQHLERPGIHHWIDFLHVLK